MLSDGTTALSGVIAVAAGAAVGPSGSAHSLALKSDGTVWAWGKNNNGQVGNNSTTNPVLGAVQVLEAVSGAPLSGITAIASGGGFCLAIDSSKNLWVWGQNQNGQLGDGTTTDRTSPVSNATL